MAASTLARVAEETDTLPFSTLDTVPLETRASRATSLIVQCADCLACCPGNDFGNSLNVGTRPSSLMAASLQPGLAQQPKPLAVVFRHQALTVL